MFVVRSYLLFTVYLFTVGLKFGTLEELAVLQVIKKKPNVTQKELAKRTGKSERTIKRLTVALTERGIIARRNGKRNGFWEVL